MAHPALRVVEANARNYRRTWRGSVISSFAVPLFTLVAMGSGLGQLVNDSGGVAGGAFVAFLAPGLLAATAMTTAAGEASYPIVAGIRWTKGFHAALATPVAVSDLVYGLFGWVGIRLLFNLVIYAAIMAGVGAASWSAAMLAVLPATLTGLAFAAPITAWVATLESDVGLSSLFRFGIMPLFLFSGTFFPIEQLPDFLEPVAFVSPLFHGVELTRAAAGVAGSPHFAWWIHAGVLVALVVGGIIAAVRTLGGAMRK